MGGGAVYQGAILSTLGDYQQYNGGCSEHWGLSSEHWGGYP